MVVSFISVKCERYTLNIKKFSIKKAYKMSGVMMPG